MSEEAVAGAAVTETDAAFTRLFATYQRPITSYLYYLVRDRAIADDLAQDTFLKAYRALPRLKAGSNLRAWLYRIATTTACNYHRRRRLVRWLPFASAPELRSEARLAERCEEREAIEQALQRIGPASADVLLLHHHAGLSLQETAVALDISPNTAKVRLYRARQAFVRAYAALTSDQETPA